MLPKKFNVFGIGVSSTSYREALEVVINAAKQKTSLCITHLAVHGLVTSARDEHLKNIINKFDIVAPDGQPVKNALNLLYKTKLIDRVCGPLFILLVCERAAAEGIGVYLYGSQLRVVQKLRDNLLKKYTKLRIVGSEPSIFRPLTADEDKVLVENINNSKAGIVFIGLGCPLQERFAYEHRNKIQAVQICVGAAFDFHAGEKKIAPRWMQKYSLEWMFRLLQEPRRLFKRYLVTNTLFLFFLFSQYARINKYCNKIKSNNREVA